MEEIIVERMELAFHRIKEVGVEKELPETFQKYFETVANFLVLVEENRQWMEKVGNKNASLEELEERNQTLYQDILPENYGSSFANPQVAVAAFGTEIGQFLAALYAELRSVIVYSYENKLEDVAIRLELFLEIYGMFLDAKAEEKEIEVSDLKEAYFWFSMDYAEDILKREVQSRYDVNDNWTTKMIDNIDGSNLRYLYAYGEYISKHELELATFLNQLPEETIALMADTYTEGYRRGFEVTRKDISIKKTVNVIYVIGMERMVKKAMENFRLMGLEPILYRAPVSFLAGRQLNKSGYCGTIPNKQFEYDHEYDSSLYLNSKFVHRKLEAYQLALEEQKENCAVMGGPAVIEGFGEPAFVPVPKKENLKLDEHKQKLQVEYVSKAKTLLNSYVKQEERSFTIIAFPTPAIGEKFHRVFEETIRLNTLDNEKYLQYQQILIDTLDKAKYVRVSGKGENHTNLTVALHSLENPAKETNFENCVADVNIPVGEVFTSPKLTGTNGVLHVPRVFLNDLEYKDLELVFQDGMIAEYSCQNFEEESENKKFIQENLLGNRTTLPMGEFAIGTNTTAYMAAKKLQIEGVLPILIAEKTGPHFAVGDTCYSMEEEVASFNPDGKQIVAKENECSALRKEDLSKAYFQCHTDITIPYDELLCLAAVEEGGKEHLIIQDGRFVLEGLEELNKPFDE